MDSGGPAPAPDPSLGDTDLATGSGHPQCHGARSLPSLVGLRPLHESSTLAGRGRDIAVWLNFLVLIGRLNLAPDLRHPRCESPSCCPFEFFIPAPAPQPHPRPTLAEHRQPLRSSLSFCSRMIRHVRAGPGLGRTGPAAGRAPHPGLVGGRGENKARQGAQGGLAPCAGRREAELRATGPRRAVHLAADHWRPVRRRRRRGRAPIIIDSDGPSARKRGAGTRLRRPRVLSASPSRVWARARAARVRVCGRAGVRARACGSACVCVRV